MTDTAGTLTDGHSNVAPCPVKLRAGRKYCSGVLVHPSLEAHRDSASDLVLTCSHFFRDLPRDDTTGLIHGPITAAGQGFRRTVTAVRTIDGTDIAVAKLARPVSSVDLPGVAPLSWRFGVTSETFGFGGNRTRAARRPGMTLLPLPFATSFNRQTFVSPAHLLFNNPPAIKGDSGGPVVVGGAIVGVQSLILNPMGRNLHVATVATAGHHKAAIEHACRALSGGPRGGPSHPGFGTMV